MRNTSRRIRNRLLETDSKPRSYVLTSNHRPRFPEVLFPARKQSRRVASPRLAILVSSRLVVVASLLQFSPGHVYRYRPRRYVLPFRFPSRNRAGESCVSLVLARASHSRAARRGVHGEARARNGSRQNQGLTRVRIPLYNGKTSDRASARDAEK